ncbi:MAG TPA: HYR domain-containing protein [Planctomycetota bacterium]|nr:HYR domain-containing protein [Planctomycetota bacterium]
MRWTLCAFILLAATARAAFIPPTVDPSASPADVHFDDEGNLVIGATGLITTPEVYPDSIGGYYASIYNMTRYVAVAPDGTMRWYSRQWSTFGTLDRPPPPGSVDQPEPDTWQENDVALPEYQNFLTALQERFGQNEVSGFIINILTSNAAAKDLMARLQERAPCARHAIETYSTVPYFHIMLWRDQANRRGVDIWNLDPNQSGIPWWRNRAVLSNPDWNGDTAANHVEIEIGRDPLAPSYVQSLVPDDSGNLIMVPDHFAWNACAANISADAGPDLVIEAGAGGFAAVTLDASRSSTDGNGPLTYTWESLPVSFGTATGVNATVTMSLGAYSVTLTVTDPEGTSATDTLLVTIQDTTLPIFSDVPADTVLEQASPAGTAYTLPMPTAWDLVSGTIAVTSDAPAVFPAGVTTVTFTAADAAGNTATATVDVTVVDTTPPVITNVPSPITTSETDPSGTPVSVPMPQVSDVADPNPVLTSDAPALFTTGTTVVTFTARDAAGNVSSATTTVTVVAQAGFTARLNATRVCALENAVLSLASTVSAPQTVTLTYSNHVALSLNGSPVPSGSSITLTQGADLTVTGLLPGTANIVASSGSLALTLSLDVTVVASVTGTGAIGQSGSPLVLSLGAGGAPTSLAISWSNGPSTLGRFTVRGPANFSGAFVNDSATVNFTRAGDYTVTTWGDGNGNGSADAAEQPRTLRVLVVTLDYLLALDQSWLLNIGLDPGITKMRARCGRSNTINLLLNAGITPSAARSYVRWSISAGTTVLSSGSFSSAIVSASTGATPGSKVTLRAWVDCNGNGVQDTGESGRSIEVQVTR